MLSLIVATIDDGANLRRCLESLACQVGAPEFEVIVIDQNDDDRLSVVIASAEAALVIRHARIKGRGASRARNFGAGLARGDWLSFPDDDCVLEPLTLARFEATRLAHPPLKVVTGQTIDDTGEPNVLRWATSPQCITPATMFSSVTEATLFVERQAYLAVGGFDERFGPGAPFPAAEGIDLVTRLLAANGNRCAYYEPAIRMRHPTKIPPYNAWAARRFHSYAIGDGALVAKSPEPHILRWGGRTLLVAAVRSLSLPPWRAVCFAARLTGLVRGYLRYQLHRWRGAS